MSWFTSTDVEAFPDNAGGFLAQRPVEHTVLLTEAAYLQARPSPGHQLYGWWRDERGDVTAAFLQAPRHPPVLSLMPQEAIAALPAVLADAASMGVDGSMVESVVAAWKRQWGKELTQRSRITLFRLEHLKLPARPAGRTRVAGPADRERLTEWFHRMMAAYPDDPSEVSYVIDDPIGYGGLTLWEVGGEPVAMASRSRLVAGMTRLGAVYAADGSDLHAQAAFAAACAAATDIAIHVLVFAQAGDHVAAQKFRELGFQPVLDRVILGLA